MDAPDTYDAPDTCMAVHFPLLVQALQIKQVTGSTYSHIEK